MADAIGWPRRELPGIGIGNDDGVAACYRARCGSVTSRCHYPTGLVQSAYLTAG